MFDAVIELHGGDGGRDARWTIVKDVSGVVDELVATGAAYRPEIRMRMPLGEGDDNIGDDGDDDGGGVVDEVREWRSELRLLIRTAKLRRWPVHIALGKYYF